MVSRVRNWLQRGFWLVVVASALVGWLMPGLFTWIGWGKQIPILGQVNGIVLGLGIIMLGMGMTVRWSDLKTTLGSPGLVAGGVAAQYLIMPLLALGLGLLFRLPEAVVVGVLLLGCCPGGTASNVIAYLSRADVPLSVTVTLASTALAPIATSWLLWWYSSYWLGWFQEVSIEIPRGPLATTLVVIVVPLGLGLGMKYVWFADSTPQPVDDGLAIVSILVIGLIVGYVTGTAGGNLPSASTLGLTAVVVVIHNLGGLLLGYGSGWIAGADRAAKRALSIEVGMQNSGLAVGLAPIIASSVGLPESAALLLSLPGILFSLWHNVSGSLLASYWGGTRGQT